MIRIIGLGSPFGDDQVGWRVIESLKGRLPRTIDLIALDRPGAGLIRWMQKVDHLVLIDALTSGAAPGSVIRLDAADLPTDRSRLTSHDLALSDTLRLAERLGCLPARIEIFGIELGSCTDEALSPVAENAADRLMAHIAGSLA